MIDNILITGANGFVGRHLLRKLIADFPRARLVLAVMPEETEPFAAELGCAYAPQRFAVEPLDLLDTTSCANLILSNRPEAVVHLAARASAADQDASTIFDTNVSGTRRLISACADMPEPPQFVAVSTGYVYGSTVDGPVRETQGTASEGRYGAYTDSKLQMEQMLKDYGSFCTIVRPFTHIGPGQSTRFAVSSFARQIAEIEARGSEGQIMTGDLSASRDLLDVRDVVRAYSAIVHGNLRGEVYNIASSKPHILADVLSQMCDLSAASVSVVQDPARLRSHDIHISSGNATKLCELTGWSQVYPLGVTLTDLLDYWRAHVLANV